MEIQFAFMIFPCIRGKRILRRMRGLTQKISLRRRVVARDNEIVPFVFPVLIQFEMDATPANSIDLAITSNDDR